MPEHSKKYYKEIKKSPYYIRVYTPTVIQIETVECGAACLGSILGYYGKFAPLEELRRTCKVSRDGSSIFNIIKAAENYGLISEVHRVELENLYQIPVPLIAFWGLNHFVVIEGFSRNHVFIMDPAIGKLKISYEDLNNYFSGVIIIFDRTTEFKKSGVRPSLIGKLKNVAFPEWKLLTLAGFTGLAQVIPMAALAFLMQFFIDHAASGYFEWKFGFLFLLGAIFLLKLLLKFAELTTLSRLYNKLSIKNSEKFLRRLLSLPYNFYLSNHIGEMANRMQLNETVYKSFTNNLAVLIINVFMAILFLGIIFLYDPWVAALILSILALETLLLRYLNFPRMDAYSYYQQASIQSSSYGISALQTMETIKSIGMDQKFFGRWAGYQTQKLNAIQLIGKRDASMAALSSFLGFFTLACVMALGSYRVMHGYLTLGMLFALIMLTDYLSGPVMRFASFGQIARIWQVNLARLEDVMTYPLDLHIAETPSHELHDEEKIKGEIELVQVRFGYEAEKDPIFQDLDLLIKPGAKVAIVGRSGSGKSTLIKLLSGLITPLGGVYFLGHKHFQDIPRSEIINSIASVEQTPFIFHASVLDNITFFNSKITKEAVIQASKLAMLHDDLLMWDEGYERILEPNGANLSNGQRQKIELARAFVRNPTILLLDEATSSLDSQTEFYLNQNIKKMDCTCVMVAHRFSSARLCDSIILLNNGKIEMQGTHEILYAKNNLYRGLYDIEQNNGMV